MPKTRPTVLTIAGYDPSAGAGLLADIKTFESNKVYGIGVVSALTWQNESKFERVEWISAEKMISQIEILLRKSEVEYVKIGLIENVETLSSVVHYLKNYNPKIRIVWDPILKASAGFDFHQNSNLKAWQDLLPHLYLITPNWQEIAWLSGGKEGHEAAKELAQHCKIFLKGGHNSEKLGYDYLVVSRQLLVVSHQSSENSLQPERNTNYAIRTTTFRPKAKNVAPKHGSGCVLSSALTAFLARGFSEHKSCLLAKEYVTRFLLSNPTLLGFHK
jgi:hydroxymethylpyrimidine/phosphomethylpyrimidine kinase